MLSHLPGFGWSRSARLEAFPGPGGVETAEAALEEVAGPAVIAVPGGIGCHRRTEIASWLQTVSPAWILASSTGSALLAAAGLLHGATAATHWLAGPLLERHGAHPSQEQAVVDGRIVTCSGHTSAFRAALVIAEAYGGQELVDRIRAGPSADTDVEPPRRTFWGRLWDAARWSGGEPDARAMEDTELLDLGVVALQPHDDDRWG